MLCQSPISSLGAYSCGTAHIFAGVCRIFHMRRCCTAQDCGRDKPDPCNSARRRWEMVGPVGAASACFALLLLHASVRVAVSGSAERALLSCMGRQPWATALVHMPGRQPTLSAVCAVCAPQHQTSDLILPFDLRSLSNINFSAWVTTLPNLAVFMVVSTMDSRTLFTPCLNLHSASCC